MRILGLRRREGKILRIIPTLWGWVLLLGIGFIGGSLAFAEYSMQPDFCRSCHIMEPYFQAWHQSTHRNVPCTDCHFEPGLENTLYGKWQASSQAVKYVTRTYGSKPHAEIRDSSCMRSGCHEKRVLEGKVNWTVKSVTGHDVTIKFDHKPHLSEERRGKQLRCVSCHSQIVQGQHLVVTLDTCFLCHFKGYEHGRNEHALGGCSACHDAPKEQIRLTTGMFNHADYAGKGVECQNCHVEVISGDGAVPKQVCWTCHNQPQQIAKYGETSQLHDTHITEHKVECSNCHVQIEHNLSAAVKPLGAMADVHATKEQGTCASCHEKTHGGPAELYRGVGGRGVPDMPSPMFRAQVDCIACHRATKSDSATAEVVGQTFVAMQESCNYCHANKYDGVLETWRGLIAAQLDNAEAKYLEVSQAAKTAKLSGTQQLKISRLLDDADHNIRLVKLGHGVHNVNYATAVLSVANERCGEVLKLLQSSADSGGASP